MSLLICIALGISFSLSAKPIDLIDENGLIKGNLGLILKYFFVLLSSYVVFISVEFDKNLIPYFLSIFLFWLLNNKFDYPSHVLFCFIPGIIIGRYINIDYSVLGIIGLVILGCLEYIVKNFKNKIIYYGLYKSLSRFLIFPLFLSIYYGDYNIFIYVLSSLTVMHFIRFLIKKGVIKIKKGIPT